MLQTRVIPTLLLKNRGLYKGEEFKKHRYIGDPINTIKIFNDKEVDEIIVLDIGSDLRPDFDYLQTITKEAFMPMCYGGGIQTLSDAQKLFYIGFEKISVNTLFFKNRIVVKEIIDTFGSQSVVLSIDVKKNIFGKYQVYSNCGKKKQKESLEKILEEAKEIGVGEILLTSIGHEGKMKGFALDLVQKVQNSINVPFIIHGGAASMNDLKEARAIGADALACGSMFVFQGIHRAVLITYHSFYQKDSNE